MFEIKKLLITSGLIATGVIGCASDETDSQYRRIVPIAEGSNLDNLVERAGTLTWSEGGAVRALDLATDEITTLATHTDGGPWGMVQLGDSLLAGMTYYCPEAVGDGDTGGDCVDRPALVAIATDSPSVLATIPELWDPHSLHVVDDRVYALSSGLADPTTGDGCGGISQLIEILPDGTHGAIAPLEADARPAIRALGGLVYSVLSDADPSPPGSVCGSGIGSGDARSLRLFDGMLTTIPVIDLETRFLYPIGGDDDQLIAALPTSAGSDIVSIDHAGQVTLLAQVDQAFVPMTAEVGPRELLLGMLTVEPSDDPEACGSAPPCLVPAGSVVRTLPHDLAGTPVDVPVTGGNVNQIKRIGDRVFVATQHELLELSALDTVR